MCQIAKKYGKRGNNVKNPMARKDSTGSLILNTHNKSANESDKKMLSAQGNSTYFRKSTSPLQEIRVAEGHTHFPARRKLEKLR